MRVRDDTPKNRRLVRRNIEVWEYPRGHIELRADGKMELYREYDRLTEVDLGTVAEHKRPAHALQTRRDDRCAPGSPSRAHRSIEVRTVKDLSRIRHLNLLREAKEHCNFLIAGVAANDALANREEVNPERTGLPRGLQEDDCLDLPCTAGTRHRMLRR
ncbi:hypothetical protein [Paraburkholderia oxyphila]|uniref:hypothetical protein n=1 Tax=Paraburkholderia oxyphila TaxID=614212 RepID=UPI000481BBAC|nr:hypothetical protein [Paraburkholderia oxyphila]